MRIAMFTPAFPVISETFILRQITGLLDMGHEVDIYASSKPDSQLPVHPEVSQYGLLKRTRYIDLPPDSGYWEMPVWPLWERTWLPGSPTSIPNVLRVMRAVPAFIGCLKRAPRLLWEALDSREYGFQARSLSTLYRLSALSRQARQYDVVHAQFGTVGNEFRFARKLWNAPLIVSFRGYDFSLWPKQHGRGIYRRLFRTVDAVTVNTDFAGRRVESLGCPPAKIHKLPSALDPHDFPFRERHGDGDAVRIATVGRLVEKKGVEYSIRAVARVLEKHPNIQYDVVGDGPLREHLEELARHLGIRRHVHFHGAQSSSYVRRIMSDADIFVLASVTAENGDEESLGNVLLEAQASGLPVVVTDHNGFPETIVPGCSGFLVPERDVESLAERIEYLIEHPEIWPSMGRAGRAHVEQRYNSHDVNSKLVELYRQAILEYRKCASPS